MFTWTRRDLASSVVAASRRGVDVEVVIDYNAGRGAGAEIVRLLKQGGVTVHLSRGGPLLHHKFLYIDGSVLVNGSANWTRAAFRQNNDCFIVIKELNDEQRNQLDALWTNIFNDSLPAR
jgi:phosphatidylserine/phosphatidylglycerophosphate/cardiolipin synthase-like enzyme